ncbi:MAG: FHA domain-containing serine/threonine-protein kinase [Brotaphodocola sp.]
MDLCPNCFEQSYQNASCNRCGYQLQYDKPRSQKALPVGLVLKQRYYLGRLLGEGGFGITYKAYDLKRKIVCCVKEYAPNGMCRRREDDLRLELVSGECELPYKAGLRRFLEEAQILSKLEQIPSVVDITDTFQEYNTAYFVMEFLDGADLRQIVKASPGRLPVEMITNVILQVAVSMDVIHTKTKIIHRDISPENIYITRDEKVKVIDFGSAKQTETGAKAGLSVVLKPKFAPPEQFSSQMVQGSFTDVYSLAGTYYYALTGRNIPSAMDRLSGQEYVPLKHLNIGVNDALSDAVDRALILNVNQRTRTMQQFIAEIAEATSVDRSAQAKEQQRRQEQMCQTQEQMRHAQEQARRAQEQARRAQEQQRLAEQQIRLQQQQQRQLIQQQLKLQREQMRQEQEQKRQQEQMRQAQRRKVAIPYAAVIEGQEKGRSWILPTNQTLKFGRSEAEANLRVRYPESISRIHCMITYLEAYDRFCIRDVSANGVYYKGQRLKKGIDYNVKPPARFLMSGSACVVELGVRYEYR